MINFFKSAGSIFIEYRGFFLQGIAFTMLIALTGTIIGLFIGLITGVIRTIPKSKSPFLRVILRVVYAIIGIYVEVFRGTPMMV